MGALKIPCTIKYTCDDINDSICSSKLPNELKQANIVPAHKKKSKLSKENYWPISVLPNVSKIYEKCLYDQIATYFEHIFSRYQCNFCKGYSTPQCLLGMIEKWKKTVYNGGVLGALLTDLSKTFGCIPHDLIIAKLEAYSFHIDVSHRDPYSVLYCSIYIYVTYSVFWKT